jgi:hydrogenase expression/formation protein HypE
MPKKMKFESTGKIKNKFLKDIVFKHLGSPNERLLYGPAVGRDAAVVKLLNDKILVVKSDPITGALNHIGRYVIIINANNIAVLGARPLFFISTILLPINSAPDDLELICRDMDYAAKEINVSIIGGHSEICAGITNPILCGFMIGETTSDLIMTAHSKPGDKLVMTKSAAIEGTAILAWDKEKFLKNKIGEKVLTSAKEFLNNLSILPEAQLALKVEGVTAMHDPTEGGILNGISEICEASNVGACIYEDLIPIAKETNEICEVFHLDPLHLISSGTLLMSLNPKYLDQLSQVLNSNSIKVTCIGEIKEEKTITLIKKNGTHEILTEQNQDQLWNVF